MGTDGKAPIKVSTAAMIESTMSCLKDWRRDPKGKHDCPNCGTPGVVITDRSTRPMAEWYHFHCDACGLDDSLCIPVPTHRPMM